MSYRSIIITTGLLAALLQTSIASLVTVSEDFSTNPSGRWSFGVGAGDSSTNRFVWDAGSSSAYTGDPAGSLNVHFDSSLPSVRYQMPLGVTVTDTNSFTLATRFSINNVQALDNTYMQIAFGLVNSTLSGADRTGSDSTSADTFHTMEFNYFPAVSPLFGSGRTLTPAVFGAQKGASDAFGNFAAHFGADSDMGSGSLPTNITLQASLAYSGFAKTLTLTMYQVNPDGSLTLLNTGITDTLDLAAAGYDDNNPFQMDTMAIMAYQDGWLFGGPATVIADLSFQQMQFDLIPEPSAALLVLFGTAFVAWRTRRRR